MGADVVRTDWHQEEVAAQLCPTACVEGVGGWACSELARLLNIQVEEDVVAYVVGAAVAAANEKVAKEEVDAFLNSFSVEEGKLRDLEAFATTLRARISLLRQA